MYKARLPVLETTEDPHIDCMQHPDINEPDIQTPIEWLGVMKWIGGTNIDHPDFLRLTLSTLGAVRFNQIAAALRPFASAIDGGGGPRPDHFNYEKLFRCLSEIAQEDIDNLRKCPVLSEAQVNTLFAIAILHDRGGGGLEVFFPK